MLRVTALRGDVLSLETESRDTDRLLHLKSASTEAGVDGNGPAVCRLGYDSK